MNLRFKEIARDVLRCAPSYRQWLKNYDNEHFFSEELLESRVREAIAHVPFYKDYGNYLSPDFNIADLPIIRKKDVMGRELEMVSDRACMRMLRRVETGGSTGSSLSLHQSLQNVIGDTAFTDHEMRLAGPSRHIAVLRGQKPKSGISEVVNRRRLLLSSYSINDDTVDDYLDELKRHKIDMLMAYPSALTILARCIRRKYGQVTLPHLKSIVTSSETFSKADREMTHEVFAGVRLLDNYGHNELACRAYCIENGVYHFNPAYGYVEFIKTGEKQNGHDVAEIVATSIMNETMPFLRYGTEDYVELDEDGNAVAIIGRTSDFAVNLNHDLVPCIVLTREATLEHVTNFQFYQNEEGVLHFRVMVSDAFSEKDEELILEDMDMSFEGKMKNVVDVVESIGRTRAGKQRRLIQELDINSYK